MVAGTCNGTLLSASFRGLQNHYGSYGRNQIINMGTKPHEAARTVGAVGSSYHAGNRHSKDEDSERE